MAKLTYKAPFAGKHFSTPHHMRERGGISTFSPKFPAIDRGPLLEIPQCVRLRLPT